MVLESNFAVEGDQKRLNHFIYISHIVYAIIRPFIPLMLIPLLKHVPIGPDYGPPLAFYVLSSLLLSLLLLKFRPAFSLNIIFILFINNILVAGLLFFRL